MSFEFRDRLQSIDITAIDPLDKLKLKRQNENTNLLISDSLPHGLLRLKQNESPLCTSESIQFWKDVSVLTIAIVFFNIVYYGLLFMLFAIQPLNLSLATHTVNFSSQIISSLFFSHFFYRTVGCKLAIIVSICTVVVYSAVQFLPAFATFVPAAVFIGAGFVTLRITTLQYGSLLSRYYVASSVDISPSAVHVIFGCVNYVPLFGGVLGTLLPAFVLESSARGSEMMIRNSSCSLDFCNRKFQMDEAVFETINLPVLNCMYTIIGVVSVVMVMTMLDGRKELEELFLQHNSSLLQQWTIVISELVVTNVRLPLLTFISGLVWSYSITDIAQTFVTCNHNARIVSILSTTQMALFFATVMSVSHFTKKINTNVVALCACTTCLVFFTCSAIWEEATTQMIVLFPLEAGFGIINGLLFLVIHIEWGSMKSSGEVTYNVCFSLQSLGCVIGFAWKIILCQHIKLYIFIGFLFFAIVMYAVAIFIQFRPLKFRSVS